MKRYDGHNFPTHWKLIRPLELSNPDSDKVVFRRSWNFDYHVWDVQVSGIASRYKTIGVIENKGYIEFSPMFRHSYQDDGDNRFFASIEDCEKDLLEHYLVVDAL